MKKLLVVASLVLLMLVDARLRAVHEVVMAAGVPGAAAVRTGAAVGRVEPVAVPPDELVVGAAVRRQGGHPRCREIDRRSAPQVATAPQRGPAEYHK